MRKPRVAIVGPRRERQGLGPFVARDLVRAGADIPCFLATSAATRDAARAELRETLGIGGQIVVLEIDFAHAEVVIQEFDLFEHLLGIPCAPVPAAPRLVGGAVYARAHAAARPHPAWSP